MFRKVSVTVITTVLIAAGISAVPASAAKKISNGVACSKLNANKKVSGYKYKCAKNPLVKSKKTKLTWLSAECLTATGQYQEAIKALADVSNISEQTATLYEELVTANAALTKTAASYDAARTQLTQFQATMNTSTNTADKQKLSVAISKLASAVLILSGSKTKLSTKVRDLESKKALLITAPEQFKGNAKDAKASAKLLCSKGL